MASESILRSRRSLIWETRGISKYQKESPVFSFMDSKWILQVIPVYETGMTCATSYNIKLKNCSAIQSFQPFEVVTFLEDRRNNVQMHCSKLAVSSPYETLFKATFDSTYEKLPDLKTYDDVAIVCTFYPSTGLALVRGSSLRIRYSIVWKTRIPTMYQKREESPLFTLLNSRWKLEIQSVYSAQGRIATYQICFKNNTDKVSDQPFDIETYLTDRESFETIWCSRLTVSSNEVLYKASTDRIYEKLPGLKFSDDIVIVCVFGPPMGLTLSEKMQNEPIKVKWLTSVGGDSPAVSEIYYVQYWGMAEGITVNVESSQCQNQDSFFQGNAAKCSSTNVSPNLKLLPDLEDLSKDFGFLLDSSFMTDIQLECGDYIIAAHKAILAARSPVFSKVMEREEVECSNITVEIKDIEPFVLREFLGYLYSGKISVDLSEDVLCKLYKTSDNYYVQGLKKLCSCCMFRNLNAENFSKFLILAYEHNDSALVVSIAGFIAERPELLISDNWIKFSDEFPRLANEIYRTHMVNVLGKKSS